MQHADNAQHAFSSDQAATLHLALPALEALHKAWTTRQTREKYQGYSPALQASLTKIEEYYNRTADSDAYTFAMRCVLLLTVLYLSSQIYHIIVLDPSVKTQHICKYWGADKMNGILERAEKKVSFLFYTIRLKVIDKFSTRSATLLCMETTLPHP